MSGSSGELFFDVEARHLRQLGRELVSARTTALAELVKNAYDADARWVKVHFIDPEQGGVLEIEDNGEGMTLDDIRSRWMCLSTSHKDRQPRSPLFHRHRAGQKGIGRFATESLGNRLVLSSTVEGNATRVVATFEWDEFDSHKRLSEIPATYVIESAPAQDKGTLLRIEGLRECWTPQDQKKVKIALRLLQPPFPLADVFGESDDATSIDPGFQVRFQVGSEQPRAIQDQDEGWNDEFLTAATAVVEATVDEAGQGRWRVRSDVLKVDEAHEHPTRLFTVGPLELRASYFIYRSGALGSIAVKVASEMGKHYGGIRVYRDGLRVPPYGDPDDDWVGLEESTRKKYHLSPHANNNWFGHVSLSRDRNVLLVDTSSREGVVENEAFRELRTFVFNVLVGAADRIAVLRGRKAKATKRPTVKSRRAHTEEVVALAQRIAVLASPVDEEARIEVATLLKMADALVLEATTADSVENEIKQELLGEIDLLRVLASIGTSIAVFAHEVRTALDGAGGSLKAIDEDLDDAPSPWREAAAASVSKARESFDRVDSLARFINGYTSRARFRERGPCALHEALRRFKVALSPLAKRESASFDFTVQPPHLRARDIAGTEIDAILTNLLTNSLKAIEGSGKADRRVIAGVTADDGMVVVRFQDTGRGIPEGVRDEIFEPFVTTTLASDVALGSGTGLGLKIVRDIAEARGGSASIAQPDDGFSTCIEVRLPLWKGEVDG